MSEEANQQIQQTQEAPQEEAPQPILQIEKQDEQQKETETNQLEQAEKKPDQTDSEKGQIDTNKNQEVPESSPEISQQALEQKEEKVEAESSNLQNLFLKADLNFPVQIKVGDPLEKGSGMSKYVVYTIKGKDCFGEFEIQRRFNEFYTIRDVLLQKWPGQYVPPIPEKSVSSSGEVVMERMRLLNIFCMKMMQIKHLYYSEEFYDVFLRSTNPDITKHLNSLPKQNISVFLDRYRLTFGIPEIREISADMISKMSGVQSFLRKQQTMLGKLLEQAKMLSLSQKGLKEIFFTIFGLNIQEYEKMVLAECVQSNQLVFTYASQGEILDLVKLIRDPLQNPLDKISDLLSTEQRDIDAFLQAFQTRDSIMLLKQKVEQKLSEEQSDLYKTMQGKSTMKGAFSKLSLDEQKQKLELQLNETQKEVDQYKKFFQLVTDVLTAYTIDKFKNDKHETYKCILNDLAQCEKTHLELQQQFWQKIQEIIKSCEV